MLTLPTPQNTYAARLHRVTLPDPQLLYLLALKPCNMTTPDSSPDELHGEHSYIQFRPKRAMASFDNLVALANHQERLKEARKMVWRDRGEPAAELNDLWECAEHAARGGVRTCRSCLHIMRRSLICRCRGSYYGLRH